MKKSLFQLALVITFIAACNKNIDMDVVPSSINAAAQSSNLTLGEKIWNVKNTGVYSDTCFIARKGYGIVLEGNSIFERANYSNWKITWINKGYPILNRAIGGTTWNEKINYIKNLATPYHPKDIMWYDGDNEFLRAQPGDTSVAGKLLSSFNKAMDNLRLQNPYARIYVMSLVTSPALHKKGFASQINKVNNGYKSRVAKDSWLYPGRVKFVDVRPYYPYTNTSLFEADLVHIKLSAYSYLYNAMKAALPKPYTGAW